LHFINRDKTDFPQQELSETMTLFTRLL
jgi:hypothetical protein